MSGDAFCLFSREDLKANPSPQQERHQEQDRILVTHWEALSQGTSQELELFPMKTMSQEPAMSHL